jgi:hypothetical protein
MPSITPEHSDTQEFISRELVCVYGRIPDDLIYHHKYNWAYNYEHQELKNKQNIEG